MKPLNHPIISINLHACKPTTKRPFIYGYGNISGSMYPLSIIMIIPLKPFGSIRTEKPTLLQIDPGENKTQSSRLAHEWWARDARVDRVHPGAPSRQRPAVGPSCDGYVHQKTEEMSRFVLCCSFQLTLTCIFLFLISLIETLVAVHKTIHDTTPQDISIEPKICLDLASSCGPWKQKAGCDLSQMKEHCQ